MKNGFITVAAAIPSVRVADCSFNEMQIEGSDVFIATFAHLKTFPFFKTLSNWFLPFYPAHSAVLENLGADKLSLAEVVQHAPYLCNSDKFSFCLSLGALPDSQRSLMSAQLEEQNAALNEARLNELPDNRKQRVSIVNAFIQDLYRFFKLFSRRREFIPVMDYEGLDMTDCLPLAQVTRDAHVLELLGALYFKNEFYDDAINCFTRLEGMDDVTDDHIYQKIGFAYQNAGKAERALTYYKRYELLHEDDAWNIRHIAACYRAIGKHDAALEYYRRAEALNPENVSLTLTIGHLLLELNRTNDALQQYFKADLLELDAVRLITMTASSMTTSPHPRITSILDTCCCVKGTPVKPSRPTASACGRWAAMPTSSELPSKMTRWN